MAFAKKIGVRIFVQDIQPNLVKVKFESEICVPATAKKKLTFWGKNKIMLFYIGCWRLYEEKKKKAKIF